jgi:hypothetical protein
MKNQFKISVKDSGIKITLTVAWLSEVLPSFAPLCELDDAESSNVCNAAFAASAQQLADILNQALEIVSQRAFEARHQIVADGRSLDLPNA